MGFALVYATVLLALPHLQSFSCRRNVNLDMKNIPEHWSIDISCIPATEESSQIHQSCCNLFLTACRKYIQKQRMHVSLLQKAMLLVILTTVDEDQQCKVDFDDCTMCKYVTSSSHPKYFKIKQGMIPRMIHSIK